MRDNPAVTMQMLRLVGFSAVSIISVVLLLLHYSFFSALLEYLMVLDVR